MNPPELVKVDLSVFLLLKKTNEALWMCLFRFHVKLGQFTCEFFLAIFFVCRECRRVVVFFRILNFLCSFCIPTEVYIVEIERQFFLQYTI